MKISVNVFLNILLILLLFVRCNEESINEPKIQKFDITGTIKSNNLFDGISHLILTLAGNETFVDTTNENGDYIFSNVPEGNYHLLINDEISEPIDTLITVNRDITLNLNLVAKVADYFPLKLNYTWKYHYTYNIGDNGVCVGVPYKKEEGLETWTVTSIHPDSVFEISINKNYVQLSPIFDLMGCVVSYDTTDNISSDTTFYIKQYDNIQIKAIEGSDLFNGTIVKRYHNIVTPESINYDSTIPQINGDYNIEIVEMKKNIGVVNYYYKIGSSSHYYHYYILELEDYSLL